MVQPYQHLQALSRPPAGCSRATSPSWGDHLTLISPAWGITGQRSGAEGASVREPPPLAPARGPPLGHRDLVVDVATAPDKKACVLDAAYGLADAKLTHGDIVTLSR